MLSHAGSPIHVNWDAAAAEHSCCSQFDILVGAGPWTQVCVQESPHSYVIIINRTACEGIHGTLVHLGQGNTAFAQAYA